MHKNAIPGLQRFVNDFEEEPLTAVIPGIAFSEIWKFVSQVEIALLIIAGMVVVTALLGMVINILSTLNERRREMAILRSVGARPKTILLLFVTEALVLTVSGILLGFVSLFVLIFAFQNQISQLAGFFSVIELPGRREFILFGLMLLFALLAGIVPAYKAYKMSLTNGLTIRL